MAGKSTERAEIEELIRISDEARGQLAVTAKKVRSTLKVPGRMVGSMRHSPKFWLFGSMAAGLAASLLLNRLPGRKKKKKKGSSLKKLALSLTLTAARPIAKVWLTNQLKTLGSQWLSDKLNAQQKPQAPVASRPSTIPSPRAQASPFKIEPDPNPQHVRAPGP